LSNREKEQLEEYYSNYIATLFRERTNTFLPVAIDNFRVSLTPVRLILILGADVTATDENGALQSGSIGPIFFGRNCFSFKNVVGWW
jgi:hypothetical protein